MNNDIHSAYTRIQPYIIKSPLIYSDWLSKLVQGEVYLKMECLQEGRSFKIRGATNALLSKHGYSSVIAASGGNHGLGIAKSAKKLGKPCKIVVPSSTSMYRQELIREAGAEVIVYGEAFDEADTYAKKLANDEGGVYVHPFGDPLVLQGQGTVAIEILDQIESPDIIMASIGGGGLLGGICSVVNSLEESKRPVIYGVETEGADSMYQSLKSNQIVKLNAITSIATTLGAKETKEMNFELIKSRVKEIFLVSDRDSVLAMEKFLDNEKILIEPAASCIVAALEKNRQLFMGKKTVLVICGSNVTLDEFMGWKSRFGVL